jgi:hypothetical protein
MTSSARALSVALAATLLITACGADDGDTGAGAAPDDSVTEATLADATDATTPDTTGASTDTTATTPDTTEVPARDVEADAAAAEDALLTLADLPVEWTEAAMPSDARSEIDQVIAECVGVDSITSTDATAATGDFTSPDGSIVVAERVGVQATERDARSVIALLTTPEVPECVADAYTSLGAAALNPTVVVDGAQFGTATAGRLAVGAAGDATQAIRVTIPVTGDPAVTQLTVDLVVVRAGRTLAALTFEANGEPTAVETIDEITAVAASLLPA